MFALVAHTASGSDITHGNYIGSGRACYGTLTITAARITWMTPFSRCDSSPYTVRNRQEGPDGLRVVYEFLRPSGKCLYHVLVLTHAAVADSGIGWNVVGYASLDAAARSQTEDALGCYLYRPTAAKNVRYDERFARLKALAAY
jgi:hypothetical protein